MSEPASSSPEYWADKVDRGNGFDYSKLTIPDMERLLLEGKKGTGRQPVSARAVLEENRISAIKKSEEQSRARMEMRERDAVMMRQDNDFLSKDSGAEKERRGKAQVLSQEYREVIATKEASRVRVQGVPDAEFFPFTDGENLERKRKSLAHAQHLELVEDMQKNMKPPRMNGDPLKPLPVRGYGNVDLGGTGQTRVQVHSFNSEYPTFLKKSRDYISRMVDPSVQRAALQQKVALTYDKLRSEYEGKKQEDKERAIGVHMNDHLRNETASAVAVEARKNQDALRVQIEEQKLRRKAEDEDRRSAAPGYFGPQDRKNLKVKDIAQRNAQEVLAQIEIDQGRRRDLRAYDLEQDRLMNENQVQDLLQDRNKHVLKSRRNREALRNSWAQQVKMKNVRAIVQSV